MKYTCLLFIFLIACNTTGKEEQSSLTQQQPAAFTEVVTIESAENEFPDLTDVVANDIHLNGILSLPPQSFASVTLVMGGMVHSTNLMPGSYVRKGAVLATLENIEFIDLQQSFLEAVAQTEYLETEYNRQMKLSEQEAASKKRFQESKAEYLSVKSKKEAAAAQLRVLGVSPEQILQEGIQPYLTLKAPISGYVTGLKLNVGKHFQTGEQICEIVDKENMFLSLTIYEKDLPYLFAGEKIDFTVNGIIGEEFPATILSIGQEVDLASRSLEVYAKAEGTHELFRPGMYVTARVTKK